MIHLHVEDFLEITLSSSHIQHSASMSAERNMAIATRACGLLLKAVYTNSILLYHAKPTKLGWGKSAAGVLKKTTNILCCMFILLLFFTCNQLHGNET